MCPTSDAISRNATVTLVNIEIPVGEKGGTGQVARWNLTRQGKKVGMTSRNVIEYLNDNCLLLCFIYNYYIIFIIVIIITIIIITIIIITIIIIITVIIIVIIIITIIIVD